MARSPRSRSPPLGAAAAFDELPAGVVPAVATAAAAAFAARCLSAQIAFAGLAASAAAADDGIATPRRDLFRIAEREEFAFLERSCDLLRFRPAQDGAERARATAAWELSARVRDRERVQELVAGIAQTARGRRQSAELCRDLQSVRRTVRLAEACLCASDCLAMQARMRAELAACLRRIHCERRRV